MPRDAVSRTANVERTGRHKWVNFLHALATIWVSMSKYRYFVKDDTRSPHLQTQLPSLYPSLIFNLYSYLPRVTSLDFPSIYSHAGFLVIYILFSSKKKSTKFVSQECLKNYVSLILSTKLCLTNNVLQRLLKAI